MGLLKGEMGTRGVAIPVMAVCLSRIVLRVRQDWPKSERTAYQQLRNQRGLLAVQADIPRHVYLREVLLHQFAGHVVDHRSPHHFTNGRDITKSR